MGDFEERLKEKEFQDYDDFEDSNSNMITDPRVPVKVSSSDEVEIPVEQPTYISPKKNGIKKFVMFAGVIVVLLIIISIVINSGVISPNRISEKQLIIGAALTMEENKSLKVEVGNQEHEIEVQNVGEDWAEIVIRSDPIKFKLKINEVIELDLDDNGQSDIRIKLFKVENGKAIIAVKRVDKESCKEEWGCGDWGACIDGKRERPCTDANNCGSEFFIPVHIQRCVGDSPVENPGDEEPVRAKNLSSLIIPTVRNNTNTSFDTSLKSVRLRFEASECLQNTELDYFPQRDSTSNNDLGIKEYIWDNSTSFLVRTRVQHQCAAQVKEGGFEVKDNNIILKYKILSDPYLQADCYCIYELVYRFTGIEEKDYLFELKPEFVTSESGGTTQYGECGDGICDYGENTSSYPYYCPEDCGVNNFSNSSENYISFNFEDQSEHLSFSYDKLSFQTGEELKIEYHVIPISGGSRIVLFGYEKGDERKVIESVTLYGDTNLGGSVSAFVDKEGIWESGLKYFYEPGVYIFEIEIYPISQESISGLDPLERIGLEITVTGDSLDFECVEDSDCGVCENCIKGVQECTNHICVDCFSSFDCKNGYKCLDRHICITEEEYYTN